MNYNYFTIIEEELPKLINDLHEQVRWDMDKIFRNNEQLNKWNYELSTNVLDEVYYEINMVKI